MSQQRRRVEALEPRQAIGKPWVDPFPLCMMLFAFQAREAAWKAGREFCPLPSPEPYPDIDAFRARMAKADRMHERLTKERA
jgi:hypothetical protein